MLFCICKLSADFVFTYENEPYFFSDWQEVRTIVLYEVYVVVTVTFYTLDGFQNEAK